MRATVINCTYTLFISQASRQVYLAFSYIRFIVFKFHNKDFQLPGSFVWLKHNIVTIFGLQINFCSLIPFSSNACLTKLKFCSSSLNQAKKVWGMAAHYTTVMVRAVSLLWHAFTIYEEHGSPIDERHYPKESQSFKIPQNAGIYV